MSGKMLELVVEIAMEYPLWLEVLDDERKSAKALEKRGLIELRNWEARIIPDVDWAGKKIKGLAGSAREYREGM